MKKRTPTGISGLDKLLKGGFPEGRCILISGPCGSGKSILGMQYIYNGITQYNEKGLFVSFEEEKPRIIENMAQFGFNLEKLEKSKKLILIGGALGGISQFMRKINAETDHIINEIGQVVKENKIQRVVIDSISLLAMLSNETNERRLMLTKLVHKLSSLGCTSLLISETKEGTFDISRFGIEEFVADGVVALYHLRQKDNFIKGIVIRKMRGTDHKTSIRLFKITKRGIRVYPDETVFTDL